MFTASRLARATFLRCCGDAMARAKQPDRTAPMLDGLQIWEIEAKLWAAEQGWTSEKSVDYTIWRWLEHGDAAPLSFWLLNGHVPALWLRVYLAKMLSKEAKPVFVIPGKPPRPVRYRFVLNGPKASKAGKDVRDLLAYRKVRYLMNDGKGLYDSAIKTVAAELGVGFEALKKIHDAMHSLGKSDRD